MNLVRPSGAGSGLVADAAVSAWGAVHLALAPVIGQRGVAALYKRTLYLVRPDYPWLAVAFDSEAPAGDFSALRHALLQQDSETAAAAHHAMLETLNRLVASLIGPSLAGRLMPAVPFPPTAGDAVQDALP